MQDTDYNDHPLEKVKKHKFKPSMAPFGGMHAQLIT